MSKAAMDVIRIFYQLQKFDISFQKLCRRAWWLLVPGTVIKVQWPREYPCDPNYSYRPWLEENIGKQTVAWDWKLLDNDVSNNLLSIKIRLDKHNMATLVKLKWS